MPTTSSIANTNDDNFEIVTSTATTITPKSTIAKGEPIKQSHWLSAFFTFQIWSNVLKQSLSQPRSLLLPSVKYVHVKVSWSKLSIITIRPFSSSSDVDKEPCTESTAVIAGGVGGGIILCLIFVCLLIAIFCICNRYCVFTECKMVCCVRLDFGLVS